MLDVARVVCSLARLSAISSPEKFLMIKYCLWLLLIKLTNIYKKKMPINLLLFTKKIKCWTLRAQGSHIHTSHTHVDNLVYLNRQTINKKCHKVNVALVPSTVCRPVLKHRQQFYYLRKPDPHFVMNRCEVTGNLSN